MAKLYKIWDVISVSFKISYKTIKMSQKHECLVEKLIIISRKSDKKGGKSDNLYNLANVSLKNLW